MKSTTLLVQALLVAALGVAAELTASSSETMPPNCWWCTNNCETMAKRNTMCINEGCAFSGPCKLDPECDEGTVGQPWPYSFDCGYAE